MLTLTCGLLAATTTATFAHYEEALRQSPPGEPYVQVSEALPLPEFIPGLGTLFVDPATLPAGSFLAYDHDGKCHILTIPSPRDDVS